MSPNTTPSAPSVNASAPEWPDGDSAGRSDWIAVGGRTVNSVPAIGLLLIPSYAGHSLLAPESILSLYRVQRARERQGAEPQRAWLKRFRREAAAYAAGPG